MACEIKNAKNGRNIAKNRFVIFNGLDLNKEKIIANIPRINRIRLISPLL
jgi:hypothetical protein